MANYTPTGPFAPGGAPGISHVFLNNVEDFLQSIGNVEASPADVTATGTTAGAAHLYQVLRGTVKAFVLQFSGYRNATTTEQLLVLPTAFTFMALFKSGETPFVRLYNSSSMVTNIRTTIDPNAGTDGGTTTQSGIYGYSYGEVRNAFDEIGLGISMSAARSGLLFMIGI